MKHAPGFSKLVEGVRASVRELSVAEVRALQGSGAAFHFVDVREDDEWRAGYCDGAMHIGRGVLERDVEAAIPDPSAQVVLYCGGGFRSVLAAESLAKMGYTNVWSMAGGIRAWREASLPEAKP